MIETALARYAASLGLVTFDETGAEGDCFIATMPSTPDQAVAFMPAPPSPQLTKAPTDLRSVQILVRGPQYDPRPGSTTAQALYDAFACLDAVTLDPGGDAETFVIGCTPVQSGPVWLGKDANNRHEWSLNLDLRVQAPTAHRPALTP